MFAFVRRSVAFGGIANLKIYRSSVVVAPCSKIVVELRFVGLTNNNVQVVLFAKCAFVVDGVFDKCVGVLTVALIETGVGCGVLDFAALKPCGNPNIILSVCFAVREVDVCGC